MREFKPRHWFQLLAGIGLVACDLEIQGVLVAGLTLYDWASGYD